MLNMASPYPQAPPRPKALGCKHLQLFAWGLSLPAEPGRPLRGTVRNATELMLPPVLLEQLSTSDCRVEEDYPRSLPSGRGLPPGVPQRDWAPVAHGAISLLTVLALAFCPFSLSSPTALGCVLGSVPKQAICIQIFVSGLLLGEPNLGRLTTVFRTFWLECSLDYFGTSCN